MALWKKYAIPRPKTTVIPVAIFTYFNMQIIVLSRDILAVSSVQIQPITDHFFAFGKLNKLLL